VDVASKNAMIT